MHWIQRHILELLSFVPSYRNRDLRPDGVESNLFQYHLGRVVKEGYVEQVDGRYRLAPKGLRWADQYSLQLKAAQPQPKVITVVGIYNQHGEYLLKPKYLQPFVDKWYVPSGKLRQGESLQQAAHRECKEKLGISVPQLEPVGVLRVAIRLQGTVITDFVGYLFRSPLPTSCSLPAQVKWQAPSELCGSDIMPGTYEVLLALSGKKCDQDILVDVV